MRQINKSGDSLAEKTFKFNIFEHQLVPQHKIISEKEREELLKRFNIVETQLPKISVKDPVSRALNAKPGDILKIIRKSQTAGEAEYYRLVVEKVE